MGTFIDSWHYDAVLPYAGFQAGVAAATFVPWDGRRPFRPTDDVGKVIAGAYKVGSGYAIRATAECMKGLRHEYTRDARSAPTLEAVLEELPQGISDAWLDESEVPTLVAVLRREVPGLI